MPDRPEVTAVEIARLAGVGRAAVSNWRRRHPDFPRPVGGSDSSPTFRLDQVERWLQGQGKIAELPLIEQTWRQLETLRDPAGHPAGAVPAAGAFLLLLHRAPAAWPALAGEPDTALATALPRELRRLTVSTLGPDAPGLLDLPTLAGATYLDLARMLARLAGQHGPVAAYEQLLARHAEANSRQLSPTPPEAAALLGALAGQPASVLDPACGLGALLLAVPGAAHRSGQEADPVLGALALLRLALHTPADTPSPLGLDLRPGSALRADAHPGGLADAVLCQPPYNERDWGHDELQYDSRWLAGVVPPRGESELAWVLHCLAHTAPGGLAALLLPPTVASRRAGRRVRAELLRSGALRAVVALPAGAAPPYGVPLHLWVLRRPAPGDDFRQVLLLDAVQAAPGEGGRDRIDWPQLHRTVLDAWRGFDAAATAGTVLPADRPGVHRAVPAIDLLDDETDLSPARHLPPAAPAGDADGLTHLQLRLAERFAALAEPDALLPRVSPVTGAGTVPTVTVGELARSGALEVYPAGQGAPARTPLGSGETALLTDHDLINGHPPTAASAAEGPVPTARPGDVLVPALATAAARVVRPGDPYDGAALGARVHLLRPDPAQLDPDHLAGLLRATDATRRASSYASGTTRLDIRRFELPRLPVERQRELGAAFRRIADFEAALQQATGLARTLTQGLTDGLAAGTLEP
ncbi:MULTISPECIES: N-6 DNA methylase [unclassified Kitasatospora]|uniref:N-6 DNA methylase n=1 Tax=unclassified Kitasatospora TaxID=2633591 RepID=UPI000ADDCB81|nr:MULTISPECIES: N-6 DNA methylase [unclassified Kitasatospora]